MINLLYYLIIYIVNLRIRFKRISHIENIQHWDKISKIIIGKTSFCGWQRPDIFGIFEKIHEKYLGN